MTVVIKWIKIQPTNLRCIKYHNSTTLVKFCIKRQKEYGSGPGPENDIVENKRTKNIQNHQK